MSNAHNCTCLIRNFFATEFILNEKPSYLSICEGNTTVNMCQDLYSKSGKRWFTLQT